MDNDLPKPNFKGQRTLAAVVFTDGVNFSARMSVDEERTLELLRQDFQVMQEQCERFEGKVLKSTGDGLLMYFVSASNAVACALEIQKQFAEAAALLPPEEALTHRIGIHLGDIFISESDIMGNGVNIAARLQSEAEPGGICISQIVYDVVKHGLTFHATYLGPRKLKNILEDVPAYNIRPLMPDIDWPPAPTIREENPGAQALVTPTVFHHPDRPYLQIATTLDQHEHILRVRKLLVCVCHQHWENDVQQLNRFPLKDLLKQLHQANPTLTDLKASLEQVVRNLSKQAEYRQVAQILSNALAPLYPDQDDIPPSLYQEVTQALEADRNAARIKKLIYCVCRNVWESDPNQLAAVKLGDLLPELLQISPTRDHLKLALNAVVATLSKPTEYTLVASIISHHCERFYANQRSATSATVSPTPPATPEATTALPISSSGTTPNLDSTGILPSPPIRFPTPIGGEDATGYLPAPPVPVNRETEVAAVPPPPPPPPTSLPLVNSTPRCPTNLFNLRLEIMRYVSPLLAKRLIFSALDHPLPLDGTSLAVLKSCELDTLLRDLFRICTTFSNLESRLNNTAQALRDGGHSEQAASAIIQAMKPYYFLQKSSQLLQTAPTETSAESEQTIATPFRPVFSQDDEATCQFLAAPPKAPPSPPPQDWGEETCHFGPPPGT